MTKDSSESSLDDDAYIDEQEDPMTDQQTQNNQTEAVAGAGNTLPIKSSGNAARSVKCYSVLDGFSCMLLAQRVHLVGRVHHLVGGGWITTASVGQGREAFRSLHSCDSSQNFSFHSQSIFFNFFLAWFMILFSRFRCAIQPIVDYLSSCIISVR